MWPSSGRCITKNTYIEILQKFFEPMHRYKILNFKIIHGLKYILNFKIQIKMFVIDSDGNG
jgi:hypothetical protein